jgi:hypothetical protein
MSQSDDEVLEIRETAGTSTSHGSQQRAAGSLHDGVDVQLTEAFQTVGTEPTADQDDECDDDDWDRLAKLFVGVGCCDGNELEGVSGIDSVAQQEQNEIEATFASLL